MSVKRNSSKSSAADRLKLRWHNHCTALIGAAIKRDTRLLELEKDSLRTAVRVCTQFFGDL
jgi:hypothetical protein